MGRMPVGPASGHILTSQGADSDLNRFYVTAYASNFSQTEFEPQRGRHVGTGYASNIRSVLNYKKELDDVDNPAMGPIVADAHASATTLRDYKGSMTSNGGELLPNIFKQSLSGFAKDIPSTLTVSKEVKQAFFDTDGSSNRLPKERAALFTMKKHDPIRDENEGYGPSYMKSESRVKFDAKPIRRIHTADSTIGRKELSGFSKSFTTEPITFRAYTAQPSYRLPDSVMRRDFPNITNLSGKEGFPSITSCRRSDGYTEGTKTKNVYLDNNNFHGFTDQEDLHPNIRNNIKKKDPLEYINITNPTRNLNLHKVQFEGRLIRDKSNNERIGLVKYGKKELSGYTTNTIERFSKSGGRESTDGFMTNYNAKFRNMNSGKSFRYTCPTNINQAKPDGFTKSIQVHNHSKGYDTTATIRKLNPYVAKSIKRRDPHYDDHTYDHKVRRK